MYAVDQVMGLTSQHLGMFAAGWGLRHRTTSDERGLWQQYSSCVRRLLVSGRCSVCTLEMILHTDVDVMVDDSVGAQEH